VSPEQKVSSAETGADDESARSNLKAMEGSLKWWEAVEIIGFQIGRCGGGEPA